MNCLVWNQVWTVWDAHPVAKDESSLGTTSEVQVSVTSHPDFVEEKVSEPIRIVCPQRPSAPKIEELRAEKPFAISIQWKLTSNEQDEISLFRVFVDDKLHGEIVVSGRQSFKHELNKLQADRQYSVYVKAVIGAKKLDGYAYQCSIESNASNELVLKCAAPPRGTTPRVERMSPSGVELVWDAPVEHAQVKIAVSHRPLFARRTDGSTETPRDINCWKMEKPSENRCRLTRDVRRSTICIPAIDTHSKWYRLQTNRVEFPFGWEKVVDRSVASLSDPRSILS